jgi:geranylgeranyl diphosphate synthase, type I
MTRGVLQLLQRRYGEALDRALHRSLQSIASPSYAGMLAYQLGYVDESLCPSSRGGGKRFRPALCLAAAQAVGGDWLDAVQVAAGIELVHNFSLIHDDIEDADPTRHHRPTVWKVWGEAQAINAGDGMFALAVGAALSAQEPNPTTLPVLTALLDMAVDLTTGQYLDMAFETGTSISVDEYLDMVSRKTGALIAFSVWAGAVLGGASDTTAAAMRSYGQAFGRAFQMHDDLRGIWAPSSITGKAMAKDLENRKKTLPVLLAIEMASSHDADVLSGYFARSHDDTAAIMRTLETLEVQEHTSQAIAQQVAKCAMALRSANIDEEWRDLLNSLVEELVAA